MKCPLLHHKEHNPDVFPGETFEDCLQEECAWWLDEMDRCAMLELAASACAVAEHLSVIREYGPGNEPSTQEVG